jgi:hypothetical protein
VLKTWLRRWLGVPVSPPPVEETPEPLAVRVAALEERQDWLEGALVRLRGRVTGGLRATDAPSENGSLGAGETPVTGQPSTAGRGNPVALAILRKRGRA